MEQGDDTAVRTQGNDLASASIARNPVRRVAVIVAVIGIFAAGLAVILPLRASGGRTPEDAVGRLLASLGSGDVWGMVAVVEPNEREALSEVLPQLDSALARLGLIAGGSLEHLDRLAIAFDSLRLRTETSGPAPHSVTAVTIVSGRVTVRADVGSSLVSAHNRDLLRRHAGMEISEAGSTRDFATHPLRVITALQPSGWHVSVAGTLSEALLTGPSRHDGAGAQKATSGPNNTTPEGRQFGAGGSDAEAAVRQVLHALAQNDTSLFNDATVPELGVAGFTSAEWLFPVPRDDRPQLHRSATIHDVRLRSTGKANGQSVRVEGLRATFGNEVHEGTVTYGDQCFQASYRLVPDTPPYATYLTCNGQPPRVSINTNPDLLARERETELPTSSDFAAYEQKELAEQAARLASSPGGTTTTLPETDAFGQPFWNEIDAQKRPAYRPFDNPLSTIAIFGKGADFPSFEVVEHDGRWYVSVVRTMLNSLLDTLLATPPDGADGLAQRMKAVADVSAAEALNFESRDPDNLLFGPPAVKNTPMVAACFLEIKAVVGGAAAAQLFPSCLRRLVVEGKAPLDTVAPALLYRECLATQHTAPPNAGSVYRRAFLADLAKRQCIIDRVASGDGPPEILERLSKPEDQPCFAPYWALARTDDETRWIAADVPVETCVQTQVLGAKEPAR